MIHKHLLQIFLIMTLVTRNKYHEAVDHEFSSFK